jgi:hypothetical protein
MIDTQVAADFFFRFLPHEVVFFLPAATVVCWSTTAAVASAPAAATATAPAVDENLQPPRLAAVERTFVDYNFARNVAGRVKVTERDQSLVYALTIDS